MDDNPADKALVAPDDPNHHEDDPAANQVPVVAEAPNENALPEQHVPANADAQGQAPVVAAQLPANVQAAAPEQGPPAAPGGPGGGNGGGPVIVPYMIGMVRETAISTLTAAGLAQGDETSVISAVPVHCVTRTIPVAGTQVRRGDRVAIDISAGTKFARPRWWESTSSLFAVLGGIILLGLFGVFGFSIVKNGNDLLQELAKFDTARGVITFLIAFSTVSIALVLVISTIVLEKSDENDQRFDHGKQVLTVLIGVLGTIVGFYFASDNKGANGPTITSSSITSAIAGTPYTSLTLTENGGTAPFKWTVKPELPKDLVVSEAGVISGTPAKAASDTAYTFTVLDANSKSDSKSLHLEVKPAGPAPTTPPPPATQGTQPPNKPQ